MDAWRQISLTSFKCYPIVLLVDLELRSAALRGVRSVRGDIMMSNVGLNGRRA
jgi:hypothetical protein